MPRRLIECLLLGLRPWAMGLGSLLLMLGLWGCATPPALAPPPPSDVLADALFATPSQPVDRDTVLALSPAMRHYMDVTMASAVRRLGARDALIDALQYKHKLLIDYDNQTTHNAAQTFEARAGNCLSLAVLVGAMAKHLTLPVQYQALMGHESWTRSGGLTVANHHVNLIMGDRLVDRVTGWSSGAGAVHMSFGDLPPGRGQALRPIGEATVLAMFMNNRAVESLVRGALDDAYAFAKEATLVDAAYAAGYNTLAVIYQHRGLQAHAERAWQAALARDADHVPALQNLSASYQAQGRTLEAEPLTKRLARLEAEPPFKHFDLARSAVQRGDFASAQDHLRIELKRDPGYHEFQFWMAVIRQGLGDANGARKHLEQAKLNSITKREVALYEAKLRGMLPSPPQ